KIEKIIKPICQSYLTKKTKFFINNTGRFVIGGPVADCGMTGRKIIVDTYGGMGHIGGGCFSGKDPTKVDRAGAYMARYVAKNIVASGLTDKCEVQLAYVIGGIDPLSINVEAFGTSKISEEKLVKIIREVFDLSPGGIIETLNLLQPIYRKTACYGHFGRNEPSFTWEKTDKVEKIRELA
ncbi:methionine adenosyltransferase domain-containing protein, partial [Patescibacteria group bacterium]|nr:methionine adenosyltransferase domain-containing protein [Patescibacteria group bacterium]